MRIRNKMVLPQKNMTQPIPFLRRSRNKKKSFKRLAIAICILLIITLHTPTRQRLFRSLLGMEVSNHGASPVAQPNAITAITASDTTTKDDFSPIIPIDEKCSFRVYDPPRHYNLNLDGSLENQPTFLSEAKYIRGMLPIVINPGKEGLKKVCMDTSEWEPMDSKNNQRWPFSDGQNPSFVSLRDDPHAMGDGGGNKIRQRIDSSALMGLAEIYGADALQSMYIGLVLFGDSQCRWNMTPEQLREQGFSTWQKAPSVRTMIVIMDSERNIVGKAVVELVQDSIWGTKRKKVPRKMRVDGVANDSSCTREGKENDRCFGRSIQQLDDPRFFFHGGSLHVLFRNGPSFGYEAQVQHPVHINAIGDGKFEAYIKASEMFEVCCGRNIAFISEVPSQSKEKLESPNNKNNEELLALTWVDPVTVEIINTPNTESSSTTAAHQESIKRRLQKSKKEKSHIHGTNGYLLPLHSTSELLGVAHFHRPEGRDKNPYARVGHHYTHAFFTIQRKEDGNQVDGDTTPKFALKRLSNEFIFESPSKNTSDGDIIQFASGLDLVGSDTEGKLLVSYGINDCESASIFLNMDYVQGLLHDVEDGDEVINVMAKIK